MELKGKITAVYPLKNTIEFKCKRGTFYYYKAPSALSVQSAYKVGQEFIYKPKRGN